MANDDSRAPNPEGSAAGEPRADCTTRRKNKRKMAAPQKRTAVSVKRISLEDGSSDVYDDADDDDDDDDGDDGGDDGGDGDGDDEDDEGMVGARRTLGLAHMAPSSGDSPSPGSDDRNNSSGSGYSPAPVAIPTLPPHLLAVGGLGALTLPALPAGPYSFLPGLPHALHAGLFPGAPHAVAPPGVASLADSGTAVVTSSGRLPKTTSTITTAMTSPEVDSNHNCVGGDKRRSPSGSQRSDVPSPCTSVGSAPDSRLGSGQSSAASRKQRKNYKNMTRERRVEANARERTRVHTISAAFESLRRAVPSYSYHQRLSKLAILRIACSYILALSRLADMDYVEGEDSDPDRLSFSECVDLCTQTIQSEGRAKRRH